MRGQGTYPGRPAQHTEAHHDVRSLRARWFAGRPGFDHAGRDRLAPQLRPPDGDGAGLAAPALLLGSTAQAKTPPKRKPAATIHTDATSTTTTTIGLPELYAGQNAAFFAKIRFDENYHYTFLQNTLGSAARPLPGFINLIQPNVKAFVAQAAAFENTGVSAYLGAAPFLQNPNYLIAAAQISQIEAYHSGFLNALNNGTLTPNNEPFTNVVPLATIQAAVTPFVGSLNGGPMPGFSTTPSAQNDIDILNIALSWNSSRRPSTTPTSRSSSPRPDHPARPSPTIPPASRGVADVAGGRFPFRKRPGRTRPTPHRTPGEP